MLPRNNEKGQRITKDIRLGIKMQRLYRTLAAPGAKCDIQDVAPTQFITHAHILEPEHGKAVASALGVSAVQPASTGHTSNAKDKILDRWLDRLVQVSGSQPVFLLIMAGLLAWAFLGINYGSDANWAVIISDVQAIFSYFFDSLLMRQLLNGYSSLLRVTARLRSRNMSHRRMLRHIIASAQYRTVSVVDRGDSERAQFAADLPIENWVGRISTTASKVISHFFTICLYWLCIAIWLGFGPYCSWSDTWQLYINSATSALMVLTFAFLANIRERHDAYADNCLKSIFEVDAAIELRLRNLTHDTLPNPTVVIPAPKVAKLQRAIFYYADVVGTLVGIALLIIVMTVWLAIGPAMGFSSNWWLVIGTYAGLIGLNDGYVLRNVQSKFVEYEDAAFEEVHLQDLALLDDVIIPDPSTRHAYTRTISEKLSVMMGAVCAHEFTVVSGVVLIIGLLVGASAMGWTETGQLLCNIPPSIIESFLMMVLLAGHDIANARRHADLRSIYVRRLRLWDYVRKLELLP